MSSRWSQVNVGRSAITRHRSPSRSPDKPLRHYTRSKWTVMPEMYRDRPKTQRARPIALRRAMKVIKERELFVDLCRKHIMNGQLANVLSTTHMESPRTTLFLIGEQHDQYHRCTSIPEMFNNLFMDNVRAGAINKSAIPIDVVIEVLQSTVVEWHDTDPTPDDSNTMLNNVRVIFQTCMAKRTCPPFVRVHWADPTDTYYMPGKRDKNIHSWLNKLSPYPLGSSDWMNDELIAFHLTSFYDAHKILTENRIVVKEIGKAFKVNSAFTQEFALEMFSKMWAEQRRIHLGTLSDGRPRVKGWESIIPLQLRRVMDIYTAARIVKLKMRHCIFYGGENHLRHIQLILQGLDFRAIQTIIRDKSCL
jgi:hypothetical protein